MDKSQNLSGKIRHRNAVWLYLRVHILERQTQRQQTLPRHLSGSGKLPAKGLREVVRVKEIFRLLIVVPIMLNHFLRIVEFYCVKFASIKLLKIVMQLLYLYFSKQQSRLTSCILSFPERVVSVNSCLFYFSPFLINK